MTFDNGGHPAGTGDRDRQLNGWRRQAPSVGHPDFRLAISRAFGTVIVTVHGMLDRTTSRELDGVLTDLIEGQGNLDVVADLWDMEAIEGESLAVLDAAVACAHSQGGHLTLTRPTPAVRELLETMGLTALEPDGRIRRALDHSRRA